MLRLVNQQPHRQRYSLPADWEAAIDSWERWLRLGGMAKSSIHHRRSSVRCLARRSGTDRPSQIDLNAVVQHCSNPGWSNDHRKSVRTSLQAFFGWCVQQGLCAHNPAQALPRVKESPPKPKPVTDEVWFALLAQAEPRTRLMALLAGEAGMRRAEIAVSHFDDLLHDDSGYSLIVHGKGDKQRVVPITDDLAHAIIEHVNGRGGFLFPGIDRWGNRVREHVTPAHVAKVVGDLMPRGWTIHKLRHRYATLGYAGTRDIRAVQEALGHVSVATTQKYVATTPGDLRRVSEAAHKRV